MRVLVTGATGFIGRALAKRLAQSHVVIGLDRPGPPGPSAGVDGADIDLIAPGVCIRSTFPNGGYSTLSGTSMASPHVAGGAALFLAKHPDASPADVKEALQGGLFRVDTGEGNTVLAVLSGKTRKFHIRILPGDKVKMEFSPHDLTRGRISYRL